ncbi:zinc finger BED domain-containing protein RICESLEEPER 3-like [Chenopodium quinoa]|uniref:zinc finger BED domain-containing protein RICESLEEPER 3-like n=1 Tax=Chenopodium quinoa TaxID=63459 RepID=UPI000B79AD08|nr:zinc finger BED domain-containing protein RICESLEEPER 3-like [Chenopodium quinoa]
MLFSGSEYPTANLYFASVLKIEHTITKAHIDPKLAPMAKVMLEKFEGYWDDYSLILSIAIVLDPRYKLFRLTNMLKVLYVEEACVEKAKVIKDALLELYNFYSSMCSGFKSSTIVPPLIPIGVDKSNSLLDDDDIFKDVDVDDSLNRPSMEIDNYLNTPRQPSIEGQNYDVLKY